MNISFMNSAPKQISTFAFAIFARASFEIAQPFFFILSEQHHGLFTCDIELLTSH
jgi:hypothetical protein